MTFSKIMTSMALGFASLALAQPNLQPDTQAGEFIFKMPAGWKQQSPIGGLVTLTAPVTHPGTETNILLITAAMGPNMRVAFDTAWETLMKQYQIQQAGQVVTQRLPGGNEALARSASVTDAAGKQWAALFTMARNQNRSELILFVTSDLDAEAYAASRRALTELLASLRFQSAGPSAAAMGARQPAGSAGATAGSAPGRIAGLYRAAARPGVDPTAGLDIFDSAKKSPQYAYLTFFSDGRVKKGLIGTGFDDYVVDSSFRHDIANGGAIAAKWGVYQAAGGQGRITFANGALGGQQLISGLRGEMWAVTQFADRLEINGDTYYRLDSGNGLTLEGVFKPYGDVNQPGIAFTRDGQFIDQGILDTHSATAVGVAGGGVAMGYGFSSPHAGRGVYRIVNYGLRMNYSNGQGPNSLFYLEPGSSRENVQVLYINNVPYKRVQ